MKNSTIVISAIAFILIILPIIWATNKPLKQDQQKINGDQLASQVLELTPDNAQTVIDNIPTILIVDFYAEWCGPCRKLKPVFEELAQEYKNKFSFIKINVDTCQEIAQRYKVGSLPTIAIMSNGKIIDQVIGFVSKEVLKEKIEQAVKGPQDFIKA